MSGATWKTNVRTGRAHLVDADRKPVCGTPRPQGGITWGRAQRSHLRCDDCRVIERGDATRETLDRLREAALAAREAAHRAFNDC